MPLTIPLTAAEARVLGSLLEKESTTPDYYPLSLNALVNACNQRSNRDPVMDLSDDEVRAALGGLQEQRLAGPARDADSRVTKYEHWLGEAFNFSRAETALLCVLLLRGPQTPGELRGRTERMHRFDEIGDVLAGLQKLMEREPPLAAVLPRQPGMKESRYAHLLSGAVEGAPAGSPTASASAGAAEQEARVGQLEATVADLRAEVAALRQRIDDLFGA
ncbi:MAG TPA: YceH family protein [Terracidiphilus sp.]|nr:YceH family protein [Terracidiphilus sp.]